MRLLERFARALKVDVTGTKEMKSKRRKALERISERKRRRAMERERAIQEGVARALLKVDVTGDGKISQQEFSVFVYLFLRICLEDINAHRGLGRDLSTDAVIKLIEEVVKTVGENYKEYIETEPILEYLYCGKYKDEGWFATCRTVLLKWEQKKSTDEHNEYIFYDLKRQIFQQCVNFSDANCDDYEDFQLECFGMFENILLMCLAPLFPILLFVATGKQYCQMIAEDSQKIAEDFKTKLNKNGFPDLVSCCRDFSFDRCMAISISMAVSISVALSMVLMICLSVSTVFSMVLYTRLEDGTEITAIEGFAPLILVYIVTNAMSIKKRADLGSDDKILRGGFIDVS